MRFEHKVGLLEAYRRCSPYVALGMWPLGCAVFDLNERTCHVYYTWEWVRKHERLHCEGHDHPGSTHMADHLKAWRGR
jgi:hypothetical protein